MGHEEVYKAYRVYDIEVGKVMITRDAAFDEWAFGFSPALPREIAKDIALDLDTRHQ
jgi:hypothetical protein